MTSLLVMWPLSCDSSNVTLASDACHVTLVTACNICHVMWRLSCDIYHITRVTYLVTHVYCRLHRSKSTFMNIISDV